MGRLAIDAVSQLELKVHPPTIAVATATLMWLASFMFPSAGLTIEHRGSIGLFVACVGFAIAAAGVLRFVRAKTTVNPTRPNGASSLVTSGVYRFTRNPMYLGLLLCLVGWAVFLANWLALPFLPAFVLYITEFQIKPEERALATLFGADYASYKASVRRWL